MRKAALVFRTSLGKLSAEELDFRARQVRETIESPGWAFLVSLLEGQREHLVGLVYPGNSEPPSQAAYASFHGQIGGIDQALQVADAVLEFAERVDEKQRLAVAAGEEQR